jgi:predicted ArsR family transcriptional regulator
VAITGQILKYLTEEGPATAEDIRWKIDRGIMLTRLALQLLEEEGRITWVTAPPIGPGRPHREYSILSAPAPSTETTKTAG